LHYLTKSQREAENTRGCRKAADSKKRGRFFGQILVEIF
jgi:hypothetical protein